MLILNAAISVTPFSWFLNDSWFNDFYMIFVLVTQLTYRCFAQRCKEYRDVLLKL